MFEIRPLLLRKYGPAFAMYGQRLERSRVEQRLRNHVVRKRRVGSLAGGENLLVNWLPLTTLNWL